MLMRDKPIEISYVGFGDILKKIKNLGMLTDHLITPEEKLSKQQRIEENRRIRSREIIHKNAFETTTTGTRCELVSMNKTNY